MALGVLFRFPVAPTKNSREPSADSVGFLAMRPAGRPAMVMRDPSDQVVPSELVELRSTMSSGTPASRRARLATGVELSSSFPS